jgi:hypothetical protein
MHKSGSKAKSATSSPRASPVAALKKGMKNMRLALKEWSSALPPA